MTTGMNDDAPRPLFTYYGGKWRDGLAYPTPIHDVIIEPFAGSAGYALRHWRKKVLLVEANPKIADVWEWVIAAPVEDILALPDVLDGQSTDDLDIPSAAKLLIGWCLGKGLAEPNKRAGGWARNPEYRSQFWGPERRTRIAATAAAIRHWEVIRASYEQAPDIIATWFIDPPYSTAAGRRYRYSEMDYPYLAHWVRNRRGQVIACGEAEETWLPFRPLHRVRGTSGRHKRSMLHEGIWSGGDHLSVDGADPRKPLRHNGSGTS